LSYRYIDCLSIEEIASRLALSKRQAYREHREGVEAVTRVLANGINMATVNGEQAALTVSEAARTEVSRLRSSERSETLDLGALLCGILDIAQVFAQDRGIQIEAHIGADTDQLTVVAHRIMLRQALLGAITYVVQHSSDRKVHIQVVEEAGCLLLNIGTVRGGNSRRPVEAISRGDLEENGRVCVALIEAQGGKIRFTASGRSCGASILLPTPKETTVLVIDDNEDLVVLLQRFLGGRHISVVGATNSLHALRLASDLQPRLIVLDIMMPQLDGWEVLQQLRSMQEIESTPIVVCSVLDQKEMAIGLGANDYVPKPVRQADFLRALGRWLGPLPPMSAGWEARNEAG